MTGQIHSDPMDQRSGLQSSWLDPYRIICHIPQTMQQWTSRQVLTLFLGLFFALGTTLSAIQASDMAVKMAMSSDMDTSGDVGCIACGSGGDEGSTAPNTCSPVCTISAGMIPLYGFPEMPAPTLVSPLSGNQSWYGRASSPDPHPPKHLTNS